MAENRYELNKQLAQMLKGGVIMDVTTPEQAKIAEAAGACAVMALERCTILTRHSSRFRLSAVRETWERRCAGSRKVLR